jgi:hypothetical protein
VDRVVTEVGSALNRRRGKLLTLLRDPDVTTVVVEHRAASRGSAPSTSRPCCRGPAVSYWSWTLPKSMTTSCVTRWRSSRHCVRACTCGVLPRTVRQARSLRSGRTRRDAAGPPVRARPDTCSRPVAGLALRGGQGGVQLGPGPRQSGDGAQGSTNELRHHHEGPTPAVSWSLYPLGKDWNAAKGDVAPWWGECSKEAFNTGLDGSARSPEQLGRLPQRCAGGVPTVQVQAPQPGLGPVHHRGAPLPDQDAVLPRLGRIKLHEDAGRPVGKVDVGPAPLMWAAVRFERGRWFVSFTVDTQRPAPAPARPDAVVVSTSGSRPLRSCRPVRSSPTPGTPTGRRARSGI